MSALDFDEWKRIAESIGGWIHCHDNYAICDDPDTNDRLGEWDSETDTGWIRTIPVTSDVEAI